MELRAASVVLDASGMLQTNKQYKVITPVQNKEGKTVYWMRIGSAFTNRDDSVNVFLDAVPKSFQIQIRELDAEDLRKREEYKSRSLSGAGGPTGPSASLYNGHPDANAPARSAVDVPF